MYKNYYLAILFLTIASIVNGVKFAPKEEFINPLFKTSKDDGGFGTFFHEAAIEKAKKAPFRAPMVIVLVTEIKQHPKVPPIEQMLSTGAAAQNILLALSAQGYAGIWKTGKLALNDNIAKYFDLDINHQILGYIYVGTQSGDGRKVPKVNIEKFVKRY